MLYRMLLAAAMLAALFGAGAGAQEEGKLAYAWRAEAKYPVFGDERLDRKVRGWVEKRIGQLMDEVKDSATADYEGSWEAGLSYELSRPSAKAVSVAFIIYTYPSGAAHPSSATEILNLSTETGRELFLGDLFDDPDKALAIFAEHAPELVGALFKTENPKDFPDGMSDEYFFEEGFLPTRENYANLSLTPEGVRVHFRQYQILPYVFGMPAPLFSLALLAPAGPNPDIWPAGEDGK